MSIMTARTVTLTLSLGDLQALTEKESAYDKLVFDNKFLEAEYQDLFEQHQQAIDNFDQTMVRLTKLFYFSESDQDFAMLNVGNATALREILQPYLDRS
jgi:hypothetical protein